MIGYTLVVSNNGPGPAASVVLTDNIPAALTSPEYSSNFGASWQAWKGTLELGNMLNGASSTVLMSGIVGATATGSIDNTATVSSATTDPAPSNNSASTKTPIVEGQAPNVETPVIFPIYCSQLLAEKKISPCKPSAYSCCAQAAKRRSHRRGKCR
jgi:uncharacterized repeat protein (TIGR01451 family)